MKQKYILFTLFALFCFKANSQNDYSVTAIPFQPFSGTLSPVSTPDDQYTQVIALPFSFDFYGNTYNQMVIGTNGLVDFRTNLAGQNCPWSFGSPIPNQSFAIKNSIFGCYEDLDNSSSLGTLTVGSYGVAPFRKFVVFFNNQRHYGPSCATSYSSFQIVLSETSNNIDVQLINRQSCTTWNGGNGVIGLINLAGTYGITPPGRNTGSWNASQEAWRFYRQGYYPNYSFVRCDDTTDGIQVFDLAVAAGDLYPTNPSLVSFYETMTDAQAQANPILNTYTNLSNPQTIYANIEGVVKPVKLSVIDCNIDADNDTVPTADEDVNNDTNLANDDTDLDGIPNYADNDDDGDLVLTNIEYAFAKNNATQNVSVLLDTDNDGTPNYLDNDDDGDNLLTWREDYNHDGNPGNDDTNSNGLPDYLEQGVALGVPSNTSSNAIKLYPNPASNELNISNVEGELISEIAIYTINGSLVKQLKSNNTYLNVSISDLQSGLYFVKVTSNDKVANLKFIKK